MREWIINKWIHHVIELLHNLNLTWRLLRSFKLLKFTRFRITHPLLSHSNERVLKTKYIHQGNCLKRVRLSFRRFFSNQHQIDLLHRHSQRFHRANVWFLRHIQRCILHSFPLSVPRTNVHGVFIQLRQAYWS